MLVTLLDTLRQQLRQVERGQHHHDGGYHAGDCQYELDADSHEDSIAGLYRARCIFSVTIRAFTLSRDFSGVRVAVPIRTASAQSSVTDRRGTPIFLKFIVQRLEADTKNFRSPGFVVSSRFQRTQNQPPLC